MIRAEAEVTITAATGGALRVASFMSDPPRQRFRQSGIGSAGHEPEGRTAGRRIDPRQREPVAPVGDEILVARSDSRTESRFLHEGSRLGRPPLVRVAEV